MPGIAMNNTRAEYSPDENNANKAKKRKLDHLVDGSIVKVLLKNFMTFNEVTFTAHPKLNLIIGPNGSGKSSIVTALILGFGGSPKDINRGDKVSQFVKSGQTKADIFIELYKKSNQNIHLRRTIFVSNESCHYYINNTVVSKKKYAEVVNDLNIKVHNLCQFLPQDRLEDFSKLDSKGLLLNALQSIENQDLLDSYNKLIQLAESMTTFEVDVKKLQKTIKSEISNNAKLETIVSSFTEKKNLENQLLTVVQKRSWTVYALVQDFIKRECKLFTTAKKQNSDILSLIGQQKQIIYEKKSLDKSLKKVLLNNIKTCKNLLEKMFAKIVVIESNNAALKRIVETAKKTFSKIEDYKQSILSMEEKLESIRNETCNVEEYKQELVEISKKMKIIDDDILPVKCNLESIKSTLKGHTGKMYAIDQELDREKRKEDGKNQLLQRKFPEMWKAVTWLRNCDKQTIFRGQVFEPLFTLIEVIDQKNARYIENIINYRDMIAFVFEYNEDLTKFNIIAKEERWQKLNSISVPPAHVKITDKPNYDINFLRQFGFQTYALDMIKVPSIIRRHLVKSYDMHNIPIGSKEVINHVQKLPNNISFFFAGNDQFIKRISTYSGEMIVRQSQISNEPQFLLFSVNSNLIQSLTLNKEEARAECEHFERQQIELTNQLKAKEEGRQSFCNRKIEIQRTFTQIQHKKNAYNKMLKDIEFAKSELKREEEKTLQFSDQKCQLCDKSCVEMKELVLLCSKYSTSMILLKAEEYIVKNCCIDVKDYVEVLKQLRKLYTAESIHVVEYLKYMQNLHSHLKECTEEALKLTKNISPRDKNFAHFKEKFLAIEEAEVDELDEKVAEIKAKLNFLIIDPNAPQLLQEYKKRKLDIKSMEKKLEDLNHSAQNQESEIENVFARWFPKLEELIHLLSSNFQKFLTLFGCNGIIDLDTGVTRYDFRAYGLLIKVQFRIDELSSMRLLDAKSQSGGERALTTALFLLALQEITHFPFRMVDEINQGMDKVYERKLMELFMDLFESRNNQYIVVTPKLIQNLSFKNTTVHTIFCLKE